MTAPEYLPLDQAATISGLRPGTIRRLLRRGDLDGRKTVVDGKRRWVVSARSLRYYSDPVNGPLLDLPGPKVYLCRQAASR